MSDESVEPVYHITWLTGEVKIEEPKYRLIWTSPHTFDIEGTFVFLRDIPAEDLAMVVPMYRNLEFVNLRPTLVESSGRSALSAIFLALAVLAMMALGAFGMILFVQTGALS